MYLTLVALSAVALALAVPIAGLAPGIWTRLGLMDIPSGRKKHQAATPLVGGVALLCVAVPLMMCANWLVAPAAVQQREFWMLLAVAAMTVLGIADDRHSLGPVARLLLAFAIFGGLGLLAPQFNVRFLTFAYLEFDLGFAFTPVSVAFTTLCLVGLVNAINMADGKNGAVLGMALGWTALLALRIPPPMLPELAVLAVVLAVLLYFNLQGRLFLGDGGAYGLAALFGLMTISIYNVAGPFHGRSISAEEIAAMFYLPVLDSIRLIVQRVARGQNPMIGDRNHFHHLLQDKLNWPANLIAYWVIALAPATVLMVGGNFYRL